MFFEVVWGFMGVDFVDRKVVLLRKIGDCFMRKGRKKYSQFFISPKEHLLVGLRQLA